ncbi:hypothetical protein ACMGE9_08535 [Macrococcus sp. EM39E]|uniref:hypothetical protein n=1 Tax=Macrococcus animalis TaxID=3395467 RepID=UPI0039BDB0F7
MQISLIKELKSLYTGEGFSSISFFLIWLYCCFNHEYLQIARQPHIALPVNTLCFILFVGTYFWKLMLNIVSVGHKMHLTTKQKRLFVFFKHLSIILLVICSMLFIYAIVTKRDYIYFGLFLFAFAFVEYINYFHIRLSYLTPREFRALLKHRRLRKSHLNRVMHEEATD